MHPKMFIDQLWKGAETDSVFVAMSFDGAYDARFQEVYKPAIESVQHHGRAMTPRRVDGSQSGDSIITEIVRGVCEARLILVDVSDTSASGPNDKPERNGNVM